MLQQEVKTMGNLLFMLCCVSLEEELATLTKLLQQKVSMEEEKAHLSHSIPAGG
jgi:hypothetical protein